MSKQFNWKNLKSERPSRLPDRYLYSTKYNFLSDDENVLEVIASSGLINRLDEIVDVKGGRYENYLKNPVVLWSHDWDSLPIARTLYLKADDNLIHTIEFAPTDEAQGVKTLYKLGFLNAWSIGFLIFDYKRDKVDGNDVTRITDWEELELSGVVIPADANALTATLSLGNGTPLRIELNGAIPYKKTPLADESEAWDGASEVAAATIDDLKIMCTWFDSEYPNVKNSYKLPHHKASGEHACVWRAVAAAGAVVMGGRGGVDIPESDMSEVKSHLEKHYHEFDKTAPWESEANYPDWDVHARKIQSLIAEIRKTKVAGADIEKLYSIVDNSLTILRPDSFVMDVVRFIVDAHIRDVGERRIWVDFAEKYGSQTGLIHNDKLTELTTVLNNVKTRLAVRKGR